MPDNRPSDLVHDLALLFVELTGRPYAEVEALLRQAHQEFESAIEADIPQAELDALKTRIEQRMLKALRTLQ
jgi:hypothetical protein